MDSTTGCVDFGRREGSATVKKNIDNIGYNNVND